ncbi:dihydrolipoyl dehydrogenase [candidate division TA06 bacterium]|nr:dihydrolipoyl dehydrogenase [candidate division TA06 bacterium]
MQKHIVVIGGGPAGYVGAIRATQLGAKVTLIEKETLGGTCLNVGCIPTKALLASAAVYSQFKSAGQFGLKADNISFDWGAVQKRKERVVKKSTAGVGLLLKSRSVEVIAGHAKLLAGKKVLITDNSGGQQTLEPDMILIATGSEPVALNIPGAGLPGVVDSTGALALSEVPKELVIIGGGVIGCEMAGVYSAFGSKVTIVEMMSQIIPGEDAEAARVLHQALSKHGVDIYLEARVEEIKQAGPGLAVIVKLKDEKALEIPAQNVLMSVGRRASIKNIGLEEAGVAIERNFIKVDARMETNITGVYAAGDCTGGWLLAHVASAEAEAAVENMMGHSARLDYAAIPRCVYTHPEIASVGILERPENKDDILVGKFPFSASGKASCLGQPEGFVKIIADKLSQEIIGGVIAGPQATELIAELGLAVGSKLKLEELISAIHAHPTLHESVREAALQALGRAIHLP